MNTYYINILIVGPKGTGKTSFINRYINGDFTNKKYENTNTNYFTDRGKVIVNFIEDSEKLNI